MPNVEVAGSGTTGWLCTIQPLPANDTSGLFRYSMPGASDRCTKDRCENYTAGLVSELDPHRRPCVVRRTGCFSGWPGIRCPRELSVWNMRPVSWTTRAVSTQRGRRFRCADADPMAVACRLAGSVFQQPLRWSRRWWPRISRRPPTVQPTATSTVKHYQADFSITPRARRDPRRVVETRVRCLGTDCRPVSASNSTAR